MYRLKKNQLGNYCSLCKQNRATYRAKYFSFYSCDECLEDAKAKELKEAESESHMTEADYQLWNRY